MGDQLGSVVNANIDAMRMKMAQNNRTQDLAMNAGKSLGGALDSWAERNAKEKLKQYVVSQGGDPAVVEDPAMLHDWFTQHLGNDPKSLEAYRGGVQKDIEGMRTKSAMDLRTTPTAGETFQQGGAKAWGEANAQIPTLDPGALSKPLPGTLPSVPGMIPSFDTQGGVPGTGLRDPSEAEALSKWRRSGFAQGPSAATEMNAVERKYAADLAAKTKVDTTRPKPLDEPITDSAEAAQLGVPIGTLRRVGMKVYSETQSTGRTDKVIAATGDRQTSQQAFQGGENTKDRAQRQQGIDLAKQKYLDALKRDGPNAAHTRIAGEIWAEMRSLAPDEEKIAALEAAAKEIEDGLSTPAPNPEIGGGTGAGGDDAPPVMPANPKDATPAQLKAYVDYKAKHPGK